MLGTTAPNVWDEWSLSTNNDAFVRTALPRQQRGAILVQHEFTVKAAVNSLQAHLDLLLQATYGTASTTTHLGVCGLSLRDVLLLHAGIVGASSTVPSLPLPPLSARGVWLVHRKVGVWSQRHTSKSFLIFTRHRKHMSSWRASSLPMFDAVFFSAVHTVGGVALTPCYFSP